MADTYKRNAIYKDVMYGNAKKGFIEVCEWKNGEGFDVTLGTHEHELLSFTYSDFDAIKKMVKKLYK